MKFTSLLFWSLAVFGAANASKGATIVWLSPITISGDADVSTSGTLFTAQNFGTDSNVTVNGVTFMGFSASGTSGTSSLTSADGKITFSSSDGASLYDQFGSAVGVFSGLSSNYQSLLSTGVYGNAGTYTFNVTLNNLTFGSEYSFRFWNNDSRDGTNRTLGGTGSNVTGGAGGVGQYVYGSFTADASTQLISFSGAGYLNALQVTVATSAIPEPSTYAMIVGVAALGLAAWRRSRRAAPRVD